MPRKRKPTVGKTWANICDKYKELLVGTFVPNDQEYLKLLRHALRCRTCTPLVVEAYVQSRSKK